MPSRPQLTPETLLELCSGSRDAAALIRGVWDMAEVYDSVVDGDNDLTPDDVHNSMAFALFGLHANPVYRDNPALQLVLMQTIALWRAANNMEQTGDAETLRSSYVMRCSPYNFMISVVLCVSGMDAAIRAAELLYSPTDEDTFEAYCREHVGKGV